MRWPGGGRPEEEETPVQRMRRELQIDEDDSADVSERRQEELDRQNRKVGGRKQI